MIHSTMAWKTSMFSFTGVTASCTASRALGFPSARAASIASGNSSVSPAAPLPSCSPHPAVAQLSRLTSDLCLQRGSPAPPCGLLPLLGRLARPPGTAVSHEMRRGPSSRRALLSRRLECGGVHAHALAQGRRVQRDAALLGSWLCQPSARPQLRDNSCPLKLCVPSVELGRAGLGPGFN